MRQHLTAERRVESRRGVLRNGTADAARSTHARYAPSPDLACWIERYWSALFGQAGVEVARAMRAACDDGARIAIIERFLRERGARPDANVTRVSSIVYDIAADRTILKVSDLVRRFEINRRTLERLFARYVGASPKWVIGRYRLHEAAEQLANDKGRLADLAAALGYADQSHFIHDFKVTLGRSPGAYAKAASR
ncbi:MAG TPA: helix-turn-helix transcriptional regulator [Vicinamibacterales bacterium]|nr:helix-turn-helix transcriptional regulator [Vicinamibacterales bacterium]